MKAFTLFLSGVTSLLGSVVASADCGSYECSNVYVDRIYTPTGGNIYIGTSGDETQLSNCVPQSSVYIVLSPAVANADRIYAALLAAQLADRLVSIRTLDGSNPCVIQYVTVDRP